MLRTFIVRNEILKNTLKKSVRLNLTRSLSVETTRHRFSRKESSLLVPKKNTQPWRITSLRFYADLPDHTKVPLPALSPTMETGTIVSWAKKEGEKLNEGDLLCEIETDKATMGFETPEEGYLAKIIAPAGSKNLPIGALVCIIVENESDIGAFANYQADASSAKTSGPAAAAPSAAPSAAASPPKSAVPDAPHTPVALPALSPTMETGTIVSWAKKEGEKLNEGDLLCEIETDKATMGFETPEEGYLAKIIAPAGSKNLPIGALVCIIVENEADVAKFKDYKPPEAAPAAAPAASAPAAAPAPAPSAPAPAAAAPAAPSGSRVYASPLARKMAKEQGLELSGSGSGVYGSITSKDLGQMKARESPMAAGLAAAHAGRKGEAPKKAGAAGGSDYEDIPITNMRQVIAKRLVESKTTIPHFYLTINCCVDKMLDMRKKINKKMGDDGVKISVNDFILKAVACTSVAVPDVNAAWLGDKIRMYKNVDVSVAVSTPTGLITPIIFNANSKGIIQISKEMKELAKKARNNKLQPHEFQGGTITVSNLGMFGTSQFCAIVNPPQSVILACGTNETRLLPDENSEKGFKACQYVSFTMSGDHRVVDGALGAVWLKKFKEYIEDPSSMIY